MPYSAVSAFSDGNVLSASQLNAIKANQDYFQQSIGQTSGVAFVATDTLLDGDYGTWIFRHRRRYLHYRIDVLTGDVDRMKISVNGNFEFDDGTNRTGGYQYIGYIDLTGITYPPSDKDLYETFVNVEHLSPSGGTCRIWYLLESDSTTL